MRTNIIKVKNRPNMFIKELDIYYKYLMNRFDEVKDNLTDKEIKYYLNFVENLEKGTLYYFELFSKIKGFFEDSKSQILIDLEERKNRLNLIKNKLLNLQFS